MDKKKMLIIIISFWLIVLLGIIVSMEFTLKSGEKVLLKTVPIDPKDPFRGYYVDLNYEISTIEQTAYGKYIEFNPGDTIYVSLQKVGDYHTIKDYSKEKIRDELNIRGEVIGSYSNTIRIRYGIESYFIPEGDGQEMERLGRDGELYVEVSIDRFGKAIISRVYTEDNIVGMKNV